MNRVDDLMTKNAMALSPAMSMKDAVRLLDQYKLDGAPVIDSDRKVVGILTEYDLSLKGTGIHLPTLLKLFEEFDFYKMDKASSSGLGAIFSMHVEDVMNKEPLLLRGDTSITEAAKVFGDHHHLNPISVVDEVGRLIGVLYRSDLIRFYAGEGKPIFKPNEPENRFDEKIGRVLNSAERNMQFVSKRRTRTWLIFSLLFLLIGFAIATVALINITFK
jgi:CBS domain-containing protein